MFQLIYLILSCAMKQVIESNCSVDLYMYNTCMYGVLPVTSATIGFVCYMITYMLMLECKKINIKKTAAI